MPQFSFVFLGTLGIDYNIFLMTRVREKSLKYGTRRGMLAGLAATGGVITSAGLVRSVLVTALTLDIGRHMWWPSRLAARRDDDPAAGPSGQLSRAQ
jgi:RND superfamily putative drug exporter